MSPDTLYVFRLGPIETPHGPDALCAGLLSGKVLVSSQQDLAGALRDLQEQAGAGVRLYCAPEFGEISSACGYLMAPPPDDVVAFCAQIAKLVSRVDLLPGILTTLARRKVSTPIPAFPNPREALSDGLLVYGGDLAPETLVLAYSSGIFPWPTRELLPWFCPERRALLEWSRLHVGRSLRRAERRSALTFTIDADFPKVIRACAQTPRPGQSGTWLSPEAQEAYIEMHRLGYAHSAEAWRGESLVAGLFGVSVRGAFAAESMFHFESDASKLLLLHLLRYVHERGLDWIDVQVMSPVVVQLGAREVSRDDFLSRLASTQALGLAPFEPAAVGSPVFADID